MGGVRDRVATWWEGVYPVAIRALAGFKAQPERPRVRYIATCPICGKRVETDANGSRIPIGHVCETENEPIESA